MAHSGQGMFSKFFSFFAGEELRARNVNEDRITDSPWGAPETPYDLDATYKRRNSYLEERSHLVFVYPNATTLLGPQTRIRLPFYEDPQIRERKRARYATLNPIGRSSNLFAYTGADAREFTLDFNLTLPNIVEHFNQYQDYIMESGKNGQILDKNKFFELDSPLTTNVHGPKAADYEEFFLTHDSTTPNAIPNDPKALELENAISLEGGKKLSAQKGSREHEQVLRTIDLIRYWTDVIRSSCYNNTSNPTLGPPIVRLTHGILFRDLPCIVDSYNITYDNTNAGYDKATLLPRRLVISMTLKEIRAGDYGVFNVAPTARSIEHDNLAGWEVIVDEYGGTLDPVPVRMT